MRFNREINPKDEIVRKFLKVKKQSVINEIEESKIMQKIEIFCTVCFESEFDSVNSFNYLALLSISRKADTKPKTKPITIIHGSLENK